MLNLDVMMLLENGAEINAKGEDGFTAIQNACFNGNIEIIKILLDQGANPFLRNDLGYDAFYYTSEENHGKKKAKEIIQLLKKFDKN
ncbi:ankyrin repeat domain-containing protein [Candidatus Gracilibacteria bacterium]|nr:ankyrin repeat domain-containing protein [Candidatus Gracilibacteria bacterium]